MSRPLAGWLVVRLGCLWDGTHFVTGEGGRDGCSSRMGWDEGGETCIHTRLAAAAVLFLFDVFLFFLFFLSSIHGWMDLLCLDRTGG